MSYLLITNTAFRLPTRNKSSWKHPRSKHWHLIDYVIVRRRDRQDVKVTRMSNWHRLCVEQTAEQITGLLSANLTCVFSQHGDHKPKKCKETGCLQAETRQQEASIHQWYRQPFKRTGTQFRECRWELDSLQTHRSLFSSVFPRTSISQTPRLVWGEWRRNREIPWRETPKHTGHTSLIPVQDLVRLPFQTYVRQSRLGSETGVVRWCEGAVYLTSPGRLTDIVLQLVKACYPCSR